MPLVIITGAPCSGKTTLATGIKAFFEAKHGKSVHLVSEMDSVKDAGFDKNDFFSDPQKEKHIRGLLKSEVLRLVTPDNVVILDGGNYIKGYRYELYCATKNSKSTQCTIYTVVNFESAWEENVKRAQRLAADPETAKTIHDLPYTRDVFDALILRYEEPNGQQRWDHPLFPVLWEDALSMEDIFRVLFVNKPPPPNMSTQNPPLSSTNFLYELDKITLDISKRIADSKALNQSGAFSMPPYPNVALEASSVQNATPPTLARLRRQFLAYAKTHHSNTDVSKTGGLFLQYLNTALQRE